MTDPTGLPAWERTAGIADYGGSTSKADWLGIGVTNPDTDVAAAHLMRLADHLASVVRVAPFANLTITCNDAAPAAPTISLCDMMTGVCLVSYEGNAAPAGFPSAARVGDGNFTVTFASSYTDSYSVAGDFEIRNLKVDANSANNINATATGAGGQVATVYVFTADTGVAVQDETVSLSVW